MRAEEAMMDEAGLREAEAEAIVGGIPNSTHAAKWARPKIDAFDPKEKAITFQVNVSIATPQGQAFFGRI